MISILDVFLNLLNTNTILFFAYSLFILRKKKLEALNFLEFLSIKNVTNFLIFSYSVIFFILLLKSKLNILIKKNIIESIINETYIFLSLFSVDKKLLIQNLKNIFSELLLAVLFCKRKFSSLSTTTFVFFMIFKTFYIPCIDKIKNFKNSCEDFSEHLQFVLILLLLGALFFQISIYKTILQFYRKRIVNIIIGSEIVYLTSIIKMVIIGHIFAFFNSYYFNNKWFMEESCEFYQKLILSIIGILSYIIMLNNIMISKKAIFRYYAIRRIFSCIKDFILDLEEFIRFRKTLINIEKFLKTPTDNDINNLSDKNCIICRDDVKPEFSKMLSCCHIFHIKCLQNWLRRQYCCPTCLSPISSNNLNFFLKTNKNSPNLKEAGFHLIKTSIGFLENSIKNKEINESSNRIFHIPHIKPDLLNVIFSSFSKRKKENKLEYFIKKEETLQHLITKIERAKLVVYNAFFFFYQNKFKNIKKIIVNKHSNYLTEQFWLQSDENESNPKIKKIFENTS
jgi:hypothetical protein